ncbi:MAG: S26 family signal peptidase [Novosphingobium sp.]|uniref:S26 family signal peptidase n=1 Tax=Novosphingobium sp. TaxID=1874826 RepID=UPI001DF6CCA8|nr:S26 family signal peptidase [Novosphingobium sp.]MCB2056472.1 S26 family signal peptidase [Novosphingobium sp.]MCP5386020.1 S26 family signal peptidase [Novosphingobium sp.]
MKRKSCIALMLAACGTIGVTAAIHPSPRLIWNASASAPIGLYSVSPIGRPTAGQLVAITPPPYWARWMAERHYLPLGVPLLKHVAALPGQHACRTGRALSVDGAVVAFALARDRRGRPLPVWKGCRQLRDGEIFAVNTAVPDSFDSRYFGPLPARSVIGAASPIYTRAALGRPFIWRETARPITLQPTYERTDP